MKKHFVFLLAFTISSMFLLNSCAILFNGTKENVFVKSMTPGGKIYIDGNLEGTDAVAKKLKRNQNHSVIVKKEGYKPATTNIDANVRTGWVVFDALLVLGILWPLPLLVDATTGAWNSLDKTNIVMELEPLKNNAMQD